MILSPKPVSTRQFTWVKATRQFVAEISSTHGFGRVYDDACDEGLTLVAPSGRQVVCAVQTTHRDAEGDITDWILVPVSPTNVPFTVTIFND